MRKKRKEEERARMGRREEGQTNQGKSISLPILKL